MITGIGLIIIPLCLTSIGKPLRLLSLVFLCSAFVAAAVISIGGFGVSPGLFPTFLFLGFFILKTTFGTRYPAERLALQVLLPFIIVIAWAFVSSIVMPRIFEAAIFVWPQKSVAYANISPLEPSSGNITQDLYLGIAAALEISASCYLTQTGLPLRRLFNTYLAAGLMVGAITVWQLISNVTGLFFPTDFFLSNPGWAILTEESIAGFVRLTGPCSEPSNLAAYLCAVIGASGWIILNGHTGRLPKIAFTVSILLVLLSTSATGYVTLVAMGGLVANYAIIFGNPALRRRVLFGFTGIIAIAITAIVTIPIIAPNVAHYAVIIADTTLNKQQSSSYNDRTEADRDSIAAMEQSYGLGVGWGSDRSSSLLPGLLAGLGAVGTLGLAWFALRIIRHVRTAHKLNPPDDLAYVMHGAAGGVIGTIIPYCVAGPTISSPDFYLLLAMLIGTAARVRHSAAIAHSHPVFPSASVRRIIQQAAVKSANTYKAWRI